MLRILFITLIFSTHVDASWASEKASEQKLLWVTPYWQEYTNEDGTGFYNELISMVFANSDITVEQQQRPFRRALSMVARGDADMTGADEQNSKLLSAPYPVFESKEVVLVRKKDFSNAFSISDLNKKIGIWYSGYTDNLGVFPDFNFVGFAVENRRIAVEMFINANRNISYMFDNEAQLKQTLERLSISLQENELEIKTLHSSMIYMQFTRNEKGKRLAKLYGFGIEQAYCQGTLQKLYDKWQHDLPLLTIDCSALQKN